MRKKIDNAIDSRKIPVPKRPHRKEIYFGLKHNLFLSLLDITEGSCTPTADFKTEGKKPKIRAVEIEINQKKRTNFFFLKQDTPLMVSLSSSCSIKTILLPLYIHPCAYVSSRWVWCVCVSVYCIWFPWWLSHRQKGCEANLLHTSLDGKRVFAVVLTGWVWRCLSAQKKNWKGIGVFLRFAPRVSLLFSASCLIPDICSVTNSFS